MYMWQYFLSSLLALLTITSNTNACSKACVRLDEYNFDKVTSKFKIVLLKFDVPQPYGLRDKTFTEFAQEVSANDDLLFAEIWISKDEKYFTKRFDVTLKNIPALKLFFNGQLVAEFATRDDWTLDNLRSLVKDNTDFYISLSGCSEKFDKLAYEFMHSENKEELLEKAEKEIEELEDEEDKKAALVYVKYMKEIIELGTDFVNEENERLNYVLGQFGKKDERRVETRRKINVLRSFLFAEDEL